MAQDRWLVGLTQDVRQGLRQLARAPAFAVAVVVLLALGIGINAATYSVVRNVLLDPLPFPASDRLTIVWWGDKGWTADFLGSAPVSGPNFLDWRDESRSFDELVANTPTAVNMTGLGEAERLQGTATTAGLFEALGAPPARGRTLGRDDEQPGAPGVAVISDAFWRNRLNADPQVLHRSLTLNGEAHAIVGVMPPGFQHPSPWSVGKPTDAWIPLKLDKLRVGRDSNQYVVLGRLKPDVTYVAAQAEMTGISERLVRAHPDVDNPGVALLIPLRRVLVGRLSGRLWMLLGASWLVFLIVCANVTGLLVARAARRRTETAIRASLGASRGRLARQSALEHLPLCVIGAGASVAVAVTATSVLRSLMPPTIPRIDEIRVDGPVLAMTLALALIVAVLASVVPALSRSRRTLADALRQGRGPAASGRGTGRRVLVVAQFALTLILAHGAALMLRSYWIVRTMDTGFSAENVLTLRVDPYGPAYERPEAVGRFFEEAVARIRSLPGVTRAAAISRLPLEGGRNNTATIEGRDPALGRGPLVETRVVTPGYFDAMGIRLVSGRLVTDADGTPGALPVAVVNQRMAREWPDKSPIGKRFRFGDDAPWLAIVGVVTDTRQWGIEVSPRPEAYMVHGGSPFESELRYFVVRTASDPMGLVGAIRREIAAVDDDQPVADIRTMADVVDTAVAERRFGTMLVGLFAVTAVVLVLAATYALMSFFVSQRSPEIGVRMAFGATRGNVLWLTLSGALTLTGTGAVIGLAGVAMTARLARGLVYGISPSDPATVAAGTLFVVLIGLAGALVPAWRATTVDPVTTLRAE